MNNCVKSGLIAFLLMSLVFMEAFAFDDNDFQYWNTESITYKINDEWKIGAEEELRFGGDLSDLYYQHTDMGFTYSGLADWLDIGLNYRLIFEEKNENWFYENRPHINVTLKHKYEGFKLSNRGRLEYRDKETGKDGWRYRNKFTVKYPIKLKDFTLNPYIADEVFADFIAEKVNRNRLYAGIDFKVLKNLVIDLYYVWQSSEKKDDWDNVHALGTKLKVIF